VIILGDGLTISLAVSVIGLFFAAVRDGSILVAPNRGGSE
jgi:hypothetical protein